MAILRADEPVAVAVIEAIHAGDVPALARLLRENPGLATARVLADACDGDGDEGAGEERARSLLHVATDWPGHFPNGVATVAALVDAGADVTHGSPARASSPRRHRCTGRSAATTSTSSMRCSTPALTSTPPAP